MASPNQTLSLTDETLNILRTELEPHSDGGVFNLLKSISYEREHSEMRGFAHSPQSTPLPGLKPCPYVLIHMHAHDIHIQDSFRTFNGRHHGYMGAAGK